MFSKLRLSQLLWIGYSLPLLLFLGLAGTIGISSSKVSDSFAKIDKAEEAIIQTDMMTISLLLMVRDFRGYVLLGREDVIQDFEKNWQDFKKSSQLASQAIERSDLEQHLVQMNRVAEQWKNSFANEVINQTRRGNKNIGLTRILSPQDLTPINEFDRLNREFNALAEQDLKNIKLEAKQSLTFLSLAGVGGAILSIVLAAVVAYWISLRISKQINEETNKITSSATEIAATADQQERVANQQAIAVNQTTTTMDELGASSQQSANQAEAAVTAAQQALTLAQGGTTAVAHTLEGMDVLKDKVKSIAEQILLLSEQTTQISAISGLVSDLANQTNMLALNAAVEAVRAGEHGKGFAVVAAEIRKLADESKRSAEKIRILVMDTQNALNSTVMVTDEGTKTVEEGVRIAKTTAEAFQGIMAGIDNVVLNNKQISLNVKQQAIAIQQVVEAMNSINVAAQESSGGISQVKVGIQKLNDAAHNLNAVV